MSLSVIEGGRHKGRTVFQALEFQRSKLKTILAAVDEIGGSAPHLERELDDVVTTLRVMNVVFAPNYSI